MSYLAPCDWAIADRFRCPSKFELFDQVMKLLPRGRAWQTHEHITDPMHVASDDAQHGTYELGGALGMGAEAFVERLTGLQRYWLSLAEVLEYLHERACALVEEMFCETTAELKSEWGHEYGFPDTCEPWDTLCDKVRAQGGATCAYLASLAARVGYEIDCIDCSGGTTANCAVAGCATVPCPCEPNVIRIRIHLHRPAAVLPPVAQPGCAVAGMTTLCDEATAPTEPPAAVVCLIERFKPAHVKAIYEVI